MARPKKRDTLSEEWIRNYSAPACVLALGVPSGIYRAFNRMSKSGRYVPRRLHLAQEVIEALLHRLSKYDKTKGKTDTRQLAVWVYLIAVRELYWDSRPSYFQMTEKDIESRHAELFGSLLRKISTGHKDGGNHLRESVVLQRNWLDWFLHTNGYDNCKNAAQDRWHWLRKNRGHIFEGLRLFPCYCPYSDELKIPSLKEFKKNNEQTIQRADFIAETLSMIHNAASAVVIKKHYRPSSIKPNDSAPRYKKIVDNEGVVRAVLTDSSPPFWPWFD